MEVAENIIENVVGEMAELTKVHTPDAKTIEEVCDFLKSDIKTSCKAVVYQKKSDDSYVIVFVRGDMDVNDIKLQNTLKEEVYPAIITEASGIVAGFIGPKGNEDKATLLFDASLKGINSLVVGANEVDYHVTGFNLNRDFGEVTYVDVKNILEDGICPTFGTPAIKLSRGF